MFCGVSLILDILLKKMFVVCVLKLSRLLQLNTTDRQHGMPVPQMNFDVFNWRSLSTSSSLSFFFRNSATSAVNFDK